MYRKSAYNRKYKKAQSRRLLGFAAGEKTEREVMISIVPKFQKLAESRNQEKYYIRGTFTRNNLDFFNDVRSFADLGFEQISIEPVDRRRYRSLCDQKGRSSEDFEEYDKLAKIMVERERSGRGFTFFHFMIDLEGGPCVSNVCRDVDREQNILQ